ncbi:MAG: DHA2 family efflux MFS transporter permease subunit [Chloroflexi bacterium]|nr:MAG: DHA2 family efflux MFS transporter permease subunit [Chloroflexota bacterium]
MSKAASTRADHSPAADLSPRAKQGIVVAIMLALFLGALDQTIVGTALPRIITELNGASLYTWVVTIYLLASTVTVPIYGKLSDMYGRKPLLLIGVGLFLVGSALAGLSQNIEQLIIFRGIQGLGAGALFPIALATIGDLFSAQERGRYQGLFGAVFGLSSLVGPALGGFLTDTLSWHWIFYVNLPIGIFAMAIITRELPTIKGRANQKIDFLGAITFAAGIIPVLIGLTNVQSNAFGTPEVAGLISLGLVILGGFLFIEAKAAEPIIPLELFRNRTFAAAAAATFFASFGFFSSIIFLPRYFQSVLGESATSSGYATLPLLLGVIISSVSAGQIVARRGRYKRLILGAILLVAAGSLLLTNLQADTNPWVLRGWMFLAGLGVGPTLSVFTIVVQNAVPFRFLGAATSNLTFFRQVGGSVGLAIVGSYFGGQLATTIPARLAAVIPPELAAGFSGGSVDLSKLTNVGDLGPTILASLPETVRPMVEPLIPAIVLAVKAGIADAIGSIFWLALVASLLAFVLSTLIEEIPLRSHGAGAPPAEL